MWSKFFYHCLKLWCALWVLQVDRAGGALDARGGRSARGGGGAVAGVLAAVARAAARDPRVGAAGRDGARGIAAEGRRAADPAGSAAAAARRPL